jgi:hypothetical protein
MAENLFRNRFQAGKRSACVRFETGSKKKDQGKTIHRFALISILKRDIECPALPAGK